MAGTTGTFALDIAKFIEKTKKKPSLVVKKIVFDMHAEVARLTPIDTGRARANWQVGPGLNGISLWSGFTKGATLLGDVGKIDLIAYIFNNVEYIQYLENGSSQKQAPHGMVRITVAKFQQYVNKAVAALGG